MRTLALTGESKLSIQANYVETRITISRIDKDYATAVNYADETYRKLNEALLRAGFNAEDIINTTYEVNRQTEYIDNRAEFKGYEAKHGVLLSFDFSNETLNKAIDSITTADKDIAFSIDFTVRDKDEYKQQLIELAIADAQNQAEFIASKSGVKLGAIQKIDFQNQDHHFVSPVAFSANRMATDISFNPENIKIEESINITWELID